MKAHHKRAGIGTILIMIGTFLIMSVFVYIGYSLWIEYRAGKAADEAAAFIPYPQGDEDLSDHFIDPDKEMPTIEIKGRKYIGDLEIPALSLKLAILGEWSYDGLNISPCRYCGSAYKNDLVIAGHNYRKHFSGIKKLSNGESVIFRDAAGNKFEYVVTGKEIVKPHDIEKMMEDPDESWDMTLFTCTSGGSARYALRCRSIPSADNNG